MYVYLYSYLSLLTMSKLAVNFRTLLKTPKVTIMDAAQQSVRMAVGARRQKVWPLVSRRQKVAAGVTTSESMVIGVPTSSAKIGIDLANITPNAVDVAQNAAGLAQNVADLAHTTTGLAQNATGLAQNATDLALNATGVALTVTDVAQIGLGQDVAGLAQNVAGLAWRGAAYLYNSSGLEQKLAQCMAEYQQAQYLEKSSTASVPNSAVWRTTPAFQQAEFLLKSYKDIERYIKDQAITDAELGSLNWQAAVTIYEKRSLPNILNRLSRCCISAGVRDVTKTDMDQRFNTVSFARIGNVVLSNAYAMEGRNAKSTSEVWTCPRASRCSDSGTSIELDASMRHI